jgi:serine/threonine protein kinase
MISGSEKPIRTPLPGAELGGAGATVSFGAFTCEEIRLISEDGASGLVYEGISSDYYGIDNAAAARLIIKECYPLDVAPSLVRDGNRLVLPDTAPISDQLSYAKYGKRYKEAFINQTQLYQGLTREQTSVPVSVRETNGALYLICDASNGDTLDKAAAQADISTQLHTLIRICEIISAMHDSGYVYLDLKPENILVIRNADKEAAQRYTGEIKLFDFDTVARIDELQSPDMVISASGDWSAYEQTHEGYRDDIGRSSDLYSLGAILFWLATGRPPSSNEVIHAAGAWSLQRRAISNVGLQNASIKAIDHICSIFNKTLTTNPSIRYEGAGAIKKDIVELRSAFEIVRLEQQLSSSKLKEDDNERVFLMAAIARLKTEWVSEFSGKPYSESSQAEKDDALRTLEELGASEDFSADVMDLAQKAIPANFKIDWVEGFWGKPYRDCSDVERDDALRALDDLGSAGNFDTEIVQLAQQSALAKAKTEWISDYTGKPFGESSRTEKDDALRTLEELGASEDFSADVMSLAQKAIPANFKIDWVEGFWEKPYRDCSRKEREDAIAELCKLGSCPDGVKDTDYLVQLAVSKEIAKAKGSWVESYYDRAYRECSQAEIDTALATLETLGKNPNEDESIEYVIEVYAIKEIAKAKGAWIEKYAGKPLASCSQVEQDIALAEFTQLGGDLSQVPEIIELLKELHEINKKRTEAIEELKAEAEKVIEDQLNQFRTPLSNLNFLLGTD